MKTSFGNFSTTWNVRSVAMALGFLALSACGDDDKNLDAEPSFNVCAENEVKTESCGENDTGLQTLRCQDDGWVEDGECVDPDICQNGTERNIDCGLNLKGTRAEICENGRWAQDGVCEDPDLCKNDTEHIVSCGRNGNGTQKMQCVDGAWENVDTCQDDPEEVCVNGDTWSKLCGPNDRGQQSLICEDGAWVEDGECQNDDVCEDESTQHVACGLHDRGVILQRCILGEWENEGSCEDPDACLLGETDNLRCKGQRIESLSFEFAIDQFWSSQILNSAEPPEFSHVDPSDFYLSNQNGLPVVFSEPEASETGPLTQTIVAQHILGEDGRKYEILPGDYHYRVEDDGEVLQEGWLRLVDNLDINKEFEVYGYGISALDDSEGTPREMDLLNDEGEALTPVDVAAFDGRRRQGYILLSNLLFQHDIQPNADGLIGDYRYIFSPAPALRNFLIGEDNALAVQFSVPHGASFSASTKEAVFNGLPHYFRFSPYVVQYEKDASDENVDIYTVNARENQPFHVIVRSEGKVQVTRGQRFASADDVPDTPIEITLEDIEEEDFGRLEFIEGEMYTNADETHEIRLFKEATGAQDFYLDKMRVWQMMPRVNGDFVYTMNYFIEPQFHWELHGDDNVRIKEVGAPGRERLHILAEKDGVSVLTQTYDPAYLYNIDRAIDGNSDIEESFFPGIEPQNLNTTILQVGEMNEDNIDPNISFDVSETWYFIRSFDGEDQDDRAYLVFDPQADTDLEACVHKPLWMSEWEDEDAWHCEGARDPDDDTFTLPLYEGQNIIRLQSENSTLYRVAMAKGLDITTEDISDAEDPDKEFGVRLTFEGLRVPIQKLSGIYNPGFPNGIWLEFDVDGFEKPLTGNGQQYVFIRQANFVDLYVEAPGEYVLENGRIHSNVLGSSFGSHRHLTLGGTMPNLNAGGGSDYYSSMPDIVVSVP